LIPPTPTHFFAKKKNKKTKNKEMGVGGKHLPVSAELCHFASFIFTISDNISCYFLFSFSAE